jgi:aldose 1-epimerase
MESDGYVGALIGRFGNRIGGARFTLEGKEYTLYPNNNGNTLHGGKVGFSHKLWASSYSDTTQPSVYFSLISPDMDEGFPGELSCTVTYRITEDDTLAIDYKAITDKTTVISLTNHAYFNLGGYASGKIHEHVLQMDADAYLPVGDTLIPTGEIRSVEGTPFDFREAKPIGKDIELAGGYDHCFCFAGGETKEPVLRIEAYEPNSGRLMQVYTDQPCVQFYSGNFLKKAEYPLKGGYPQTVQTAFCLETQKMPDSVHHPHFTDVMLMPHEKYDHTTEYVFSVIRK